VWGIILKEWKGSGKTTIFVLLVGLAALVFSVVFPKLFE
jgi:L-rhamnose-H+ transport protein